MTRNRELWNKCFYISVSGNYKSQTRTASVNKHPHENKQVCLSSCCFCFFLFVTQLDVLWISCPFENKRKQKQKQKPKQINTVTYEYRYSQWCCLSTSSPTLSFFYCIRRTEQNRLSDLSHLYRNLPECVIFRHNSAKLNSSANNFRRRRFQLLD